MKEKIKNTWSKFKNFYKRNYEKNKVLTIILTILAIPLLIMLIAVVGIILFYAVIFIFIIWLIKVMIFGFGKKKTSSYTNNNTSSSGKTHYGYSEEDVLALMNTEPKLSSNPYDWYTFAEALNESKYTKEIKVMYAGNLPIYIFPRDKKPKINIHFLKENFIESGGNLFEKAQEHFTTRELNNGDICVIYQEKRLTSKDM